MEKLRFALEAIVREVCEKAQVMTISTRSWETSIVEQTDGGTNTSYHRHARPDYPAFIRQLRLEKLNSLDQLVQIIRDDPALASKLLVDIGGEALEEAQHHSWVSVGVAEGLERYFVRVGGVKYDEPAFNFIVQRVMDELEGKYPHQMRLLSPLRLLQLSAEAIQIAPGLRLVTISPDEAERLVNHLVTNQAEMTTLKAAIESTYRFTLDSSGDDEEKAMEMAERLVTALRLVTGSNVQIAFTEVRSLSLLPRELGFKRSNHHDYKEERQAAGYDQPRSVIMGEDKWQPLTVLWSRLQDSPNVSQLRLALRRWNTAVGRLDNEDRLIDYWIALESLFSGDSSEAIIFKLSLRAASYVGTTGEERLNIFNELKDSYAWRSTIVHGLPRDTRSFRRLEREADLPTTVARTADILRNIILKLLDSSEIVDLKRMELRLLAGDLSNPVSSAETDLEQPE